MMGIAKRSCALFFSFCFFITSAQTVQREYNNYFHKEVLAHSGNSQSEKLHREELLMDWNRQLITDIESLNKKKVSDAVPDEQKAFLESDKEQLELIYNENLIALGLKKEVVAEAAEEKVKKEIEPAKVKEETAPVVEEKAEESPAESESTIIEGVYYRLQFAALSVEKSTEDVQSSLGLEEKLEKVKEDSLFKYQMGNFKSLEEARSAAEKFKASSIDCFVVGYGDGKKL